MRYRILYTTLKLKNSSMKKGSYEIKKFTLGAVVAAILAGY